MNLTDLDTFLRVVDTGSFTRAAQRLGVPKSTVSRRVTRLEDSLGVPLLARKPRSFTVTAEGKQLHLRCAPALDEISTVEQSLTDATAEVRGRVRVTGNNDLHSTTLFAELLSEFRQRWPHVTLDVELTSRRVDLIEEGFDVALRAHSDSLPDSDVLTARRLATANTALYASPGFLERAGPIRTPKALAKLDCLSLRVWAEGGAWQLRRGERGELRPFPIRCVVSANEVGVLLMGAIRGAGIAQLPNVHAEPYVERGELVRVLRPWNASGGSISLVWPLRRYPSPRVRAFIDFTTQLFAERGADCFRAS